MIGQLSIRDLGVIRDATVDFHPGLTVVTGETGAGKTMIVSGIGLLLGDRADPGSVRHDAARAVVQGRLLVADQAVADRVREAGGDLDSGLDGDDAELVVARHVTVAGRSRAFLGGAQVPVSVCAALTTELVAIHGQSEQGRLVDPQRQRELLDRYAGPALAGVRTEYRRRWADFRTATTELAALRSDAQARAREIDLLRFGIAEVERVAPEPEEDLALAAEASRLQSADDLRLAAGQALAALSGDDASGGADDGGASGRLSHARRCLDGAAGRDDELTALAQRIAEVSYLLTDAASDLARYVDGLRADPARLEWIAGRRAQLSGLTRKYGSTATEVVQWAAQAQERLQDLEHGDDRVEALSIQLTADRRALGELAGELTQLRTGAAAAFAPVVQSELSALALPHARLAFVLTPAELGPDGADTVDLTFSANPGGQPRSLGRVASGGELSRVRLALEMVLAADRSDTTLVFDEVDAGVGGKVAVEIGRRLAELARRHQVIVVTHLAQVAAFADRHLVVVKAGDGQVSTSGVVQLAEGERAAELASMMAGLDTTESALAHAGELVELAATVRGRR